MMAFSRIHKTIALLFTVASIVLWATTGVTQTEWTKYEGNPVLDRGPAGAWDYNHVTSPSILYEGMYKMWHGGGDGAYFRIGYATSSDGINWNRHPTPVLDLGPPGSWDDIFVDAPTVIYDGTYKMWYQGYDGSNWRIGYATSVDGIVWEKHPGNPVLDIGSPGAWDNNYVASPSVLSDGTYEMWYSGHDGSHWRIGYATSADGIAWNKHNGNPVLDLGTPGEWDDNHIGDPIVLPCRTNYQMWYTGHDGDHYSIGYATSSDGITWEKHPDNPVLDIGPPGAWDERGVAACSVYLDKRDDEYAMWYCGTNGAHWIIGYATSRPCPFTTISPGSVDDLYLFRDNLLAKNSAGRSLTQTYYQYSPEVAGILLDNPALLVRSAAILTDIMPGIRFLLGNRLGRDIVMTPLRVTRIALLFRDIGRKGSKELAEALSMLSNQLSRYKGMRISRIWQAVGKQSAPAPGMGNRSLTTTWGTIQGE